MKLTDYRNSLPSKVTKEDLIGSLEFSLSAITAIKKNGKQTLKVTEKSGPTNVVVLDSIDKKSKLLLKSNPFSYLMKNYKNYSSNLLVLKERVEDLAGDIDTETATVDVVTLIALTNAYLTTSMWMVDYISQKTKAAYLQGRRDGELAEGITSVRSVIRKLMENAQVSLWGLKSCSVDSDKFNSSFSRENAIFVTENTEAELKAMGKLRNNPLTDPMTDNFIGNPFYVLGSYFVAWSAHSYKLVAEELQGLELMLSELEKGRDSENPQVQRELIILNNRIAEKQQLLKDIAR